MIFRSMWETWWRLWRSIKEWFMWKFGGRRWGGFNLSRNRKLPLKYPFNACLSYHWSNIIQWYPMTVDDCGEREVFVFCFFRGCSASGFRILKAFAIQTFRSYSIMRGLPGSAGFLGPGQAYRLQQTYILRYCSVLLEITWSSFQYCTALVL